MRGNTPGICIRNGLANLIFHTGVTISGIDGNGSTIPVFGQCAASPPGSGLGQCLQQFDLTKILCFIVNNKIASNTSVTVGLEMICTQRKFYRELAICHRDRFLHNAVG